MLDPEGAVLALGVSAWHAANRTAAEDYRPLTNDERAQPRNLRPADQPYFKALGQHIASARSAADLTQPQLAFYELGKRRVPVSLLPGLAKVLDVSVDALIADDGLSGIHAPPPRRTRRGPVSRLEQQLDAVARLPKAEQKFVSRMIDNVLAQYASTGQEAATAS